MQVNVLIFKKYMMKYLKMKNHDVYTLFRNGSVARDRGNKQQNVTIVEVGGGYMDILEYLDSHMKFFIKFPSFIIVNVSIYIGIAFN